MSTVGLIPQSTIRFEALPSRGISQATSKRYRYGISTYKGKTCQVAQFTDETNTVVAQKLRFPDKDFRWLGDHAAVKLFGLDRARPEADRLVITEGELDALAVHDVLDSSWFPVVSLPDGAASARKVIKNSLKELDGYKEIFLCFDQDEAGAKAVEECRDLFKPGRLRVTRLPLKDACDMLVAGKRDELRRAIYESPKYTPAGIVGGDDIIKAIVEGRSVGGTPYALDCLNTKLTGMRPKELVLLTGGTGSGKSTLSRQLAQWALSTDHAVGYVALEEDVRQSALGIYGMHLSRHLQLVENLPMEDVRRAHAEIGSKFYLYDHFGSQEGDALLNQLRYMIKGMGCDVVFLDHISIALSGLGLDDEQKALAKMMTDLRSLVEETGITLFVISHLRRPHIGSHEEGKKITLGDLRGSHSLAQIPDIVVAVERNQQSEDIVEANTLVIRVLKNRPVGRLGVCGRLRYDRDSGRLVEVDEDLADTPEDFDDTQDTTF